MQKTILICLVAYLFFGFIQPEPKKDVLWYSEPANIWEEALPLGNGRIGLMVFGDPVTERFQLNDDSG